MACDCVKRFCAALTYTVGDTLLEDRNVVCINQINKMPCAFFVKWTIDSTSRLPVYFSACSGQYPLLDGSLAPVQMRDLVKGAVYLIAKLDLSSSTTCGGCGIYAYQLVSSTSGGATVSSSTNPQ